MTRESFISSLLFFSVLFSPALAVAQQNVEEKQTVVSDSGWAAFSGFAGFAALFPLIPIAATLIYQPDKYPPNACRQQPELCQRTTGQHLLMATSVVAVGSLIVGTAFLGRLIANELELSPELGWSLAGGLTGTAITSMLYLAIPPWEPSWLHQTVGVLTIAGGGVGAGLLFRRIAQERSHAWPEFGFALGGLVLGLGIGTLLHSPELNEYPVAPQLLAGLGALAIGSAASLLWGYEPTETRTRTAPMTLSVPMLHVTF